jgi:hypothetical protein
MRLLRPSPGEAVDRQTILLIKLKKGQQQRGFNPTQFQMELNEIQAYLENSFLIMASKEIEPEYNGLMKRLTSLNERIWDLVDRMHELKRYKAQPGRPAPIASIAEAGMLIADLNDERAAVVQQVNGLFGVTAQEKLYEIVR